MRASARFRCGGRGGSVCETLIGYLGMGAWGVWFPSVFVMDMGLGLGLGCDDLYGLGFDVARMFGWRIM